jgi:hypothetical protein
MQIDIEFTDLAAAYELTETKPPDGTQFEPLVVALSNEAGSTIPQVVTVVLNINVNIDVAMTVAVGISSWLVRKVLIRKGYLRTKMDGLSLPVNVTDTPKLIAAKIEQERKESSNKENA